jgi:hypothetical protein
MTNSWMMPRKRIAVTRLPAWRSLSTYASLSTRNTSASAGRLDVVPAEAVKATAQHRHLCLARRPTVDGSETGDPKGYAALPWRE